MQIAAVVLHTTFMRYAETQALGTCITMAHAAHHGNVLT